MSFQLSWSALSSARAKARARRIR